MTAPAYKAKTGRKWRNDGKDPKQWREDRKAAVTELLAKLDEWKVQFSDAYLAELLAKFDNYHGNNPLLIEMSSGGYATDVDARRAWFERERSPIGKDTGIKIVAPEIRKVDDPDKPGSKKDIVTGYHIDHVFDWRHTVPKELVKQWKEDHPETATNPATNEPWPDGKSYRLWGDETAIKDWHDTWEPIPGNV